MGGGSGRLCGGYGQAEEEAGALTWCTLHPNIATVQLQYTVGDGQAQATAFRPVGARFIHTIEPLKQVWQLIFRDSDSGIDDLYFQVALVGGDADRERAPLVRKLDGIFNQVFQYPLYHRDITLGKGCVFGDLTAYLQFFLGRFQLKFLYDVVSEFRQGKVLDVGFGVGALQHGQLK